MAEDVLTETQRLRMELVRKLAPNEALMSDPKFMKVFLGALKDADSQELGKQRLQVDQNTAESDRELAKAFAENMKRMRRVTGNPFERQEGNVKESTDASAEADNLPKIQTVEGETGVGISTVRYDEFMQQFDEKNKDKED